MPGVTTIVAVGFAWTVYLIEAVVLMPSLLVAVTE
jgi:hypothetical protein